MRRRSLSLLVFTVVLPYQAHADTGPAEGVVPCECDADPTIAVEADLLFQQAEQLLDESALSAWEPEIADASDPMETFGGGGLPEGEADGEALIGDPEGELFVAIELPVAKKRAAPEEKARIRAQIKALEVKLLDVNRQLANSLALEAQAAAKLRGGLIVTDPDPTNIFGCGITFGYFAECNHSVLLDARMSWLNAKQTARLAADNFDSMRLIIEGELARLKGLLGE